MSATRFTTRPVRWVAVTSREVVASVMRAPVRHRASAARSSRRVPLWCTGARLGGQRRADVAAVARERMSRQWLASGCRGVRHAGRVPPHADPMPTPEAHRSRDRPTRPTRMTWPSRRGAPGALRDLAERARRLHAASGWRAVIGITGSPGAGKTTLARLLVDELNGGAAVDVEPVADVAGATRWRGR